jgi:hypothetical protein
MATDLGFLLALIVFPQGTLNTLSSPLREMLHLQHAEAAELLDVYKGAWKLSWCHIVLKACFMSNHYFQTFFFCHFQITLKKKKNSFQRVACVAAIATQVVPYHKEMVDGMSIAPMLALDPWLNRSKLWYLANPNISSW